MAEKEIKIGQTLLLGRYGGEPILWRCVDIDENGPLFLADKVLCVKPFDAAGNHTYLDGTPQADRGGYRAAIGSDFWETSNLRAWLNSSAHAGETFWMDGCPPSSENLWDNPNAYAKEEGFLSESHFTESEKSRMKTVVQDCLLNDADLDHYKKETLRAFSAVVDVDFENRIQERIIMYSHKVADRIFLLDVLQQRRVRQNSEILGEDYHRGVPSRAAGEQNGQNAAPQDSPPGSSPVYMNCWLRTPLTRPSDPSAVLIVKTDGTIGYCTASSGHVGVRPAFYLEQDAGLSCKTDESAGETTPPGTDCRGKTPVRILGVGTAGICILNRMIADCGEEFGYLAIDQDPSALECSRTKNRIWAREKRRIGLGANPLSVPESIADVAGEIAASVGGAPLVILTGGLGRIFGTNALPMIAQIVKNANREAIVAAVVTKPFRFEKRGVRIAEEGFRLLLPCVDCLIAICEDDILEEPGGKNMTIEKAFEAADRIAVLAIRCIADAILRSGLVYPDPAEILDMLRQAGAAGFGTGAAGIGRPIEEAIQKALYSPSLGLSGHPADKILLRLSCSDGISFREMAEAMEHARQMLGNHTELYFGVQTGEIPDGFAEASAIAVWH